MLELNQQERIDQFHQHFWIDYPQAVHIISTIRNMASSKGQICAPCLMVAGEGGAGKTSLIKQILTVSENWGFNLASVSLSETFTNSRFKETIVTALGAANLPGWKPKHGVPGELESFLVMRNIRILLIDEFNDSLTAARNDRLKNLSLLKSLSGSPFNLMLVCFGTSESVNALSIDKQLKRRFEFIDLQTWSENENFRSLLASIEEFLPLKKPSRLYRREIVRWLLQESDGTLDKVLKHIRFAGIQAIINKTECIEVEMLDLGKKMRWNYANC